jgi:N-acetylglucosamine-6-phosphate deacetylase
VNGYKGVSFADPEATLAEFREASRAYLADSGCVAFLPTVVTASDAAYREILPKLASLMREEEFAGTILGVHLEGL